MYKKEKKKKIESESIEAKQGIEYVLYLVKETNAIEFREIKKQQHTKSKIRNCKTCPNAIK